MLADEQIERYSRQIILPQVGGKGQENLLRACVLVNGIGPLQDVALLYLAAAGIGTIGVRTDEESVLFSELVQESPNAQTTVLRRLNPDCTVVRHNGHDGSDGNHLSRLVQGYTLVLSEPDMRLHEACYVAQRPLLCAQTTGTHCWFFTCRGYEANQPCLHCATLPLGEGTHPLFDGLAAAFLGAQIATEVVKIILGLNQSDGAKLFRCEFPDLRFHVQRVWKNPDCSRCGRASLS
jgi:adenylyltransferase/sulfurtransferase